jgi:hypothetical protein
MIGKVVENSMNFGGLVDYLKREMKHATIIAHEGVCIVNRDAIVDSFRMQVEETCSTIAKPVGHIALSWKAEDAPRLTDDFMAKVAQEYLNMMDIRNTQFIIARHFDTNHPHCHILYNRVDNDGHTISDSNIRRRNVDACKKLNQKYGFTLGKKGDHRHQNPDKLKVKALARYQMCAKVLAARQQSRSWNEFRSNLEKVGIKILFRYGKDAGIKGIIFADDERSLGGSKLNASLSLKELDKAFGGLFQSIDYGTTVTEQSAKVQIMQSATAENVQPKYHLTEATPVESLPSAEPGNSDNDGGSDWLAIAFDVAMEMIVQPHIAQTSCGGGGGRKYDDWGERDKNKYQPYKRRR